MASANTAGPNEVSAVQRVINTTELLEEILHKLDMKTLLLSQRVNTQFKDVLTAQPSFSKSSSSAMHLMAASSMAKTAATPCLASTTTWTSESATLKRFKAHEDFC